MRCVSSRVQVPSTVGGQKVVSCEAIHRCTIVGAIARTRQSAEQKETQGTFIQASVASFGATCRQCGWTPLALTMAIRLAQKPIIPW